jgi:hypothetical protein
VLQDALDTAVAMSQDLLEELGRTQEEHKQAQVRDRERACLCVCVCVCFGGGGLHGFCEQHRCPLRPVLVAPTTTTHRLAVHQLLLSWHTC